LIDMEKQNRVYQYIIAGLILLNALLIAWQWFGGHRRPPRPEDILRKELQLTDEQMNAYREMIREHRVLAEPIEKEIHDLKKQLFDFDIDSLPDKILDHIERLVSLDVKPDVSTTEPFGEFVTRLWEMKATHG